MLAAVNRVETSEQMRPPVLRGLCLTLCLLLVVSVSPWLGAAHSDLTWANVTVSGVAAKRPSALQTRGRGCREGGGANGTAAH